MDFRVDADFLDHPKTIRLLQLGGPDSVVHLFRLWAYATKHCPSGVLDGLDAESIDLALRFPCESRKYTESAERFGRLFQCGFAHRDKNGNFVISNWEKWQPWVIGSKERSEQARKAAKAKWDKKKTKMQTASHEHPISNTQSMRRAPADSNAPSPSPTPDSNIRDTNVSLAVTRKEPTGDHAEFVRYFCESCERIVGIKYLFQGKKDGQKVKEILSQLKSLDLAKAFVDEFFAMDDPFFEKSGYTIGVFSTQLNKIAQRLAANKRPVESEIDRFNRLEAEKYMNQFDKDGNRVVATRTA